VGKKTSLLPADIFIRSVGWRLVAEEEVESYDAECLSGLQAFADGVNAYIMNRQPEDVDTHGQARVTLPFGFNSLPLSI